MPIYTGHGKPGDDDFHMEEFQGFDVSPNGKYWGSGPINNDGILLSELEGMTRRERRVYTRKIKQQRFGKSK